MKLDLILKDITDPLIRENFARLQTALLQARVLGPDFKFMEIDISSDVTAQPIAHGLGYAPTDVLILSSIGDYNFFFDYVKFDKTNLFITTHGPVRLRFLVGRYEDKGKRPLSETQLPFVAPT
jgi:hypothetical protein